MSIHTWGEEVRAEGLKLAAFPGLVNSGDDDDDDDGDDDGNRQQ